MSEFGMLIVSVVDEPIPELLNDESQNCLLLGKRSSAQVADVGAVQYYVAGLPMHSNDDQNCVRPIMVASEVFLNTLVFSCPLSRSRHLPRSSDETSKDEDEEVCDRAFDALFTRVVAVEKRRILRISAAFGVLDRFAKCHAGAFPYELHRTECVYEVHRDNATLRQCIDAATNRRHGHPDAVDDDEVRLELFSEAYRPYIEQFMREFYVYIGEAALKDRVSSIATDVMQQMHAGDANPSFHGVLVVHRGAPVGFFLSGGPTPNGRRIRAVYTSPAHRGKGVTKRALAMYIRDIYHNHPQTSIVFLAADAREVAPNRLYRSLGFLPVGPLRASWTVVDSSKNPS
eukprot:ANDGO_08012.mRNA.1 hypothetical protein